MLPKDATYTDQTVIYERKRCRKIHNIPFVSYVYYMLSELLYYLIEIRMDRIKKNRGKKILLLTRGEMTGNNPKNQI